MKELENVGNETALVPQKPQEVGTPMRFTEGQLQTLKDTICTDLDDNEFKLYVAIALRSGMDPFQKQLIPVKRYSKSAGKNVMTIQTGIDGYRTMGERTGNYAGNDEYLFDEGLTQYQMVMAGRKEPVSATATVYKVVQGVRVPFTESALWNEYVPKDRWMWDKMPYNQLGKCAEAKAGSFLPAITI